MTLDHLNLLLAGFLFIRIQKLGESDNFSVIWLNYVHRSTAITRRDIAVVSGLDRQLMAIKREPLWIKTGVTAHKLFTQHCT
jgi:hypothetical protein